MHKPEGVFGSLIRHLVPQNSRQAHRAQDIEKLEGNMNIIRKVGLVTATVGLSLGLLGMTTPAQADSTWGYSVHK